MSKQSLLKLHRWIGGILAILLVVQALSGTVLVFRDEIERIIHPALIVQPGPVRQPVQALLDTVRARHPEAVVQRAEFARADDQTVLFKLKRKTDDALLLVAVDPYRNVIVRDGGLGSWPTEWIFAVHEHLLIGPVGETVVGIEGLGLLFMAITGPIVWWPGRRRLKQGFKVRWDAKPDPKWRSLHRAVGTGAALFLLVSAVTGVLMVWKEPFRDALGTVTRADGKPAPKVSDHKIPLVAVDQLIAQAHAAYPGPLLRQLRFSSGGRVVAVYLDSDRTIRADGTIQLYYNAESGAAVGRYVSGEMPAGSEFIDWIYTVHTGLWGGVLTRALLVLTGFVLAGLAGSGAWLWYVRARRVRENRAARATAAAQ